LGGLKVKVSFNLPKTAPEKKRARKLIFFNS
jgi:hypothetical protein